MASTPTMNVQAKEHTHERIIFMFPGQGSQYSNMAMELYQNLPEFAQYVDQGMAYATNCLHIDLFELITKPQHDTLNQTQYAQPALFIIEYALAQTLIHYEIKPDALIGHSLGEYVAACVAGVFSFEDGVRLVCQRGLLMSSASEGSMMSVECIEEEAKNWCALFDIELALHNAPSSHVFSGTHAQIHRLEDHLVMQKTKHQRLSVSHAFHSKMMEPIKEAFLNLMESISLHPPTIPMISNVTGEWMLAEDIITPRYWYTQLRNTVQLSRGFNTLLKEQHLFFIEVGMGHSLCHFLAKTMNRESKSKSHYTHLLPNQRKKTSDMHQWLSTLSQVKT